MQNGTVLMSLALELHLDSNPTCKAYSEILFTLTL